MPRPAYVERIEMFLNNGNFIEITHNPTQQHRNIIENKTDNTKSVIQAN